MATTQDQTTRGGSLVSKLHGRGESVVFRAGLAAGAVVLGILAASSWWTLKTYRSSLERGKEAEVRATALVMAEAAAASMSEGGLTGVRKLVADTAASSELSACRVTLLDGKIIADVDGSRFDGSVHTLDATLPTGSVAAEATFERVGNVVRGVVPLTVTGRGKATLEVEATLKYPLLADWEVQVGIGVIGVLGMGGLLGTYRLIRKRMRALGAISEALRLSEAPGANAALLSVSPEFGDEASAWNKLLTERDDLRERSLLAKASDQVVGRGSQEGDLSSACDAMWSGFMILDPTGTVKYANGAAAVLLRCKRDELVGAGLMSVVTDAALEAIIEVAAGRTRQRTSVELERKAGAERTVLRLTARPMRREDSAAAVVVVEDVTQQRVADESRNAFVAQATHELRTPLTNIRLYVETMVEDGENDPAVRSKCLNVIAGESRRLERIVADMLSVSEIEAGALKLRAGEIRVDALFEELRTDFLAQAEDKEIKLRFDLPPKLPVMQGDRDKLLLALHNLIGNALKYTPAGGEVTVKVDAGKDLVVAVSDNGIGISPEEHELIFEKFYRAKDRRISGITGSGIGLSLARQVVRLHNGDITVTSQMDKGSTFTLSVPIGIQASGVSAKAA